MPRLFRFLVLLLLFAAPFFISAQSVNQSNFTSRQANLTVENATNYVAMINESSYLVFSPNLAQAYSYLNMASHSPPSSAVLYARLAVRSAQNAYSDIGIYRELGAFGALVFTIIIAFLLYRVMIPVRKRRYSG